MRPRRPGKKAVSEKQVDAILLALEKGHDTFDVARCFRFLENDDERYRGYQAALKYPVAKRFVANNLDYLPYNRQKQIDLYAKLFADPECRIAATHGFRWSKPNAKEDVLKMALAIPQIRPIAIQYFANLLAMSVELTEKRQLKALTRKVRDFARDVMKDYPDTRLPFSENVSQFPLTLQPAILRLARQYPESKDMALKKLKALPSEVVKNPNKPLKDLLENISLQCCPQLNLKVCPNQPEDIFHSRKS